MGILPGKNATNVTAFRELISGERRGIGAALARAGLSGLSAFYGLAVRGRNFAYDNGLKKVHSVPVPIISVGNLTTGGTGKTPFVAHLANWYHARGLRVVFLSRGYGARDGAANDEKLVLDALCPGIPHVQQANRVASAAIAGQEHAAQILILDDGFQHRRIDRDLDIVLIDALCPWGYGRLLPRGMLREPLASLARADLVVLTRADQCTPQLRQSIIDRIASIRGDNQLVEAAYQPISLISSAGETAALLSLQAKPIIAFCGIGNPDAFRRTLATCGFQVSQPLLPYPDHHNYGPSEIDEIANVARRANASAIVTTQKDLVKIKTTKLGDVPLWAVQIGTQILSGEGLLEAHLEEVVKRVHSGAGRPDQRGGVK